MKGFADKVFYGARQIIFKSLNRHLSKPVRLQTGYSLDDFKDLFKR
jgi:hypothetical protein